MNNFVRSILAGVTIAIGAYINLKIGGIAGAIFFSVGLFLVCIFGLNLYTGKVGYTGIIKNLPILLGNLIGSFILYFYPTEQAKTLMENKIKGLGSVTFVNAFICGILIYTAVEAFKQGKEYMIALCVPAFILFGAEHCVADMCYAVSARMFSLELIEFLILVILGNSAGSLLFRFITKE